MLVAWQHQSWHSSHFKKLCFNNRHAWQSPSWVPRSWVNTYSTDPFGAGFSRSARYLVRHSSILLLLLWYFSLPGSNTTETPCRDSLKVQCHHQLIISPDCPWQTDGRWRSEFQRKWHGEQKQCVVVLKMPAGPPIANFFASTTIMFGDTAGFTAWSSSRLYDKIDSIAREMNVFKIEAIGDCYVTVTGLPNPQKAPTKISCMILWLPLQCSIATTGFITMSMHVMSCNHECQQVSHASCGAVSMVCENVLTWFCDRLPS